MQASKNLTLSDYREVVEMHADFMAKLDEIKAMDIPTDEAIGKALAYMIVDPLSGVLREEAL